jgi:SAM-dependent methyltransferase
VKVWGQWAYLYQAIDKLGNTVDFYLSPTRNTAAAKRFLGKAFNGLKDREKPFIINTDKVPTYAAALAELKKEGKCPDETQHRQVKYLNNVIEADHGKLKQLIRPIRGFKTLMTAYATIAGFEVTRTLRKGQASAPNITNDNGGKDRIVERAFGLGASALPKRFSSSTPTLHSRRPDGPTKPTTPSRARNSKLQQSRDDTIVADDVERSLGLGRFRAAVLLGLVIGDGEAEVSSTQDLLGANALEYQGPMDAGLEDREFAWAAMKRRQVVALLRSIAPIANAVDIGCRSGREAAFYREAAQIGCMHGFDIAATALDAATQRGIRTAVWISGEQACPAADGSFDAIIALDVIEHLFDTDVFLRELYRVLAPGGHMIIGTPNLAWWWSRLRLLAGAAPAGIGAASPWRAFDPALDAKHLRVHVAGEWEALFKSHGLRCVTTMGYNFPGLLKMPFGWLDNQLVRIPTMAHSSLFLLRKIEPAMA